jgi:catechol 2,3-dioxygenase-like lactoylglutathione lyase family enzyme
MITGFHTIIYSDDAPVTRTFFRDVLGWPSLDAGDGWLIFKTPPSELGVHPTDGPETRSSGATAVQNSSLMCDDIEATIADLRAKGVEVRGVDDQGFGLVSSINVPGAGWLMLYQPRHPLAHQLSDT